MPEKVSLQGNVVEYTYMSRSNGTCHAVRVDKDHWMNPKTGEISEYVNRGTTRADNYQELRKSFAKLRKLINTNCTDYARCRWCTLTYRENMTDAQRLYRDFDRFRKRLRRHFDKLGYKFEYIAVPEPQERGAWHLHVILIFDKRAPYIDNNKVFAPMWGQGFTKVKALDPKNDNLGAYLTAYLCDIPAREGQECDVVKVTKGKKAKRIIKGGRLHLYPVGMNVYRHSRGIRKPCEFWLKDDGQREEVNRLYREFQYSEKSYTACEDTEHPIHIVKRWFNWKRPNDKMAAGAVRDGGKTMDGRTHDGARVPRGGGGCGGTARVRTAIVPKARQANATRGETGVRVTQSRSRAPEDMCTMPTGVSTLGG